MDFFTLLLAKYGSHEKLAKATGKSRQTISYNNLIQDSIKRNAFGLELLLILDKNGVEFIKTDDDKMITFKIEKL